MPELDTQKLGSLVATASNAKRYKIYLIDAAAGPTVDAIRAKQGWEGGGLIAYQMVADASGQGTLDLARLKSDIEQKTQGMAAGAEVKSFVVGFGDDPADVQAVAGPVLTVKKAAADESELNPFVMRVIADYNARHAGKGYWWPQDGSAPKGWHGNIEPTRYNGRTFSSVTADGRSYCSGIVFEVMCKALEMARAETGKTLGCDLEKVRQATFVANGSQDRQTNNVAYGIVHAGIGVAVDPSQAKKGDFAQLWWEGSGWRGHTVIAQGPYAGGQIDYWSSQERSSKEKNGVGFVNGSRPAAVNVARIMLK